MSLKNKVIKCLPRIVLDLYVRIRGTSSGAFFLDLSMKEVFEHIYHSNAWGLGESRSGPGSSSAMTREIVGGLNELISALRITSILDAPCGDFNWMKKVNLQGCSYLGIDLVEDLIAENNIKHYDGHLAFQTKDLTRDVLPQVDLIVCRDCLVHFAIHDIWRALENLIATESKYLLMTHFSRHQKNREIITGQWRPLNFEAAPFNFPSPIHVIAEYTKPDLEKEMKGKCLALWEVSKISKLLAAR